MAETDAEVIAASLEDPHAFVTIFQRHFGAISRYMRRRLSRMLADDLAAEVFATAFTRRAAFDSERPDALPWLYGIAANLLRAHVRTEERQLRIFARTGVDPLTHGTTDVFSSSAFDPPLAQALLELGPADREVLLLFALADLSYEQIADVLDLPTGTVKSRLNRARRLVRHRLTEGSQLTEGSLMKEATHG